MHNFGGKEKTAAFLGKFGRVAGQVSHAGKIFPRLTEVAEKGGN